MKAPPVPSAIGAPHSELPPAPQRQRTSILPASLPPVATPPAPAPRSLSLDVAPVVLDVVAEKTGYPAEMLTLEMGLDSDLGIDSIKRVEIMAALRGRLPTAPEIKPEHLGTLQTLQQVVDFLTGGPGNATSGEDVQSRTRVLPLSPMPSPGDPGAKDTVDFARARGALLQVVAEKPDTPSRC